MVRGGYALGIAAAGLAVAALLAWHHATVARETLILRGDPDTILSDPARRAIALRDGAPVFRNHCAGCHGAAGRGDPHRAVPNLTDGDFLYGAGRVGEIEQIVLHGIRAGDTRGWDLAEMPGFAKPVPYAREPLPSLGPQQVGDLVAYVRRTGPADANARGRILFTNTAGCWDCHGSDGGGDPSIGAPNLNDRIWLKGDGSAAAIVDTIEHGLAGVCPAFARILTPYQARVVAAYAAALHPRNPHR